jgi:hypothetical protein
MKQRGITLVLWLTSLMTVPVPYFAVERGREPVAQLLVFATVTSAAALGDPDFAAQTIAGLFVVHSLLYAGLFYVVARVLARRLGSIASVPIRCGLLTVAVAALLALGLSGAFVTPFARSGRRGSLLDLFD